MSAADLPDVSGIAKASVSATACYLAWGRFRYFCWEPKPRLPGGSLVSGWLFLPSGELFGVPHGGKSFRIMAVDIQTIRDGKIAKTYHLENWLSAIGQLRGK
jgi:hypothetical protein